MKKIGLLFVLVLVLAGCRTTPIAAPSVFSFGVIADIQYADKDGGRRDYRGSHGRLEKCVADLNSKDLLFTIQLGDIIDGNASKEKTLSDLESTLKIYNSLSMPAYHVAGNHCMTAGKEELLKKLGLESLHYDFTLPEASGWRFIVLDGNDAGYGVVSKEQREWLANKLKKAGENKERVIVFSHFPLLRDAKQADKSKDAELLKVISESDCVVAYFAGHHHGGGYLLYEGVHHVTLKGMVEAGKENAYAVITVSGGQIEKIGFCREPSRNMPIRGLSD